jgi:hypothetical protein
MVTITLNLGYVLAFLLATGLFTFVVWLRRYHERVGPWRDRITTTTRWHNHWYQRPGSQVQFRTSDEYGHGWLYIRIPQDALEGWAGDWRDRFSEIFGYRGERPHGAHLANRITSLTRGDEEFQLGFGLVHLLGGPPASDAIETHLATTSALRQMDRDTVAANEPVTDVEPAPAEPRVARLTRTRRQLDL